MGVNLSNNKCLNYGIFVLLISVPIDNYAQSIKRQCISSYGSSGVTENVFIGQTVGQPFNTSLGSNSITVSQGFQQSNNFVVEEFSGPALNNLNVSVFPNPTSRSITIASKEALETSYIQVTDINGKRLFSEKVPNLIHHTINCSSWVNGVYMITIFDSFQNNKTLKLLISK